MAAKFWHKAPFVRLLMALATGIVVQWHVKLNVQPVLLFFVISLLFVSLYSFTNIKLRYQLGIVNGAMLFCLIACVGGLLVWNQDVRNEQDWIGNSVQTRNFMMVTLEELLVEKTNSYKALASFEAAGSGDSMHTVKGKLILYFKKDFLLPPLSYGSQIIFYKPLQEIKNAGNPGSFDYRTYSLFQGITHQVFLGKEDYVVLSTARKNAFKEFIFQSRSWIIGILRKFIHGEKEQGLAEALLIGYKDDLDKNLVQAYSNTGVVHVIAISGLHLGLIYGLLLLLTRPLKRNKRLILLRWLLIVVSLWLFSILAGGQPSVLRSAVMFTAIATAELVLRRTNIFNTLAFSALVLLCINPFWLWDVGFQLSYSAVLSIVLFFQPIYHWFDFKNKGIDFLWKLTAVTLAAQILTLPISIYHFHQMPLLFLLSNFIAVPLSSMILIGEIALCALFFLPAVASVIGAVLRQLIMWMNTYIEQIDSLPFAVWDALSIDIPQMMLLLAFAVAGCYWLMEKQRRFAWIALSCFSVFLILRAVSFVKAQEQRKLIVYNIPKHTALDIVNGRRYSFIGDSALLFDDFARNFHLQPSRILHRIIPENADADLRSFAIAGKQIIVIDRDFPIAEAQPKQIVDLVVVSKNPRLYISRLLSAFVVRQIVIDGSVPPWKAALWKKDCDSLKIPCYNVAEEGAFVMNW